jgi:hypothetical protein
MPLPVSSLWRAGAKENGEMIILLIALIIGVALILLVRRLIIWMDEVDNV